MLLKEIILLDRSFLLMKNYYNNYMVFSILRFAMPKLMRVKIYLIDVRFYLPHFSTREDLAVANSQLN